MSLLVENTSSVVFAGCESRCPHCASPSANSYRCQESTPPSNVLKEQPPNTSNRATALLQSHNLQLKSRVWATKWPNQSVSSGDLHQSYSHYILVVNLIICLPKLWYIKERCICGCLLCCDADGYSGTACSSLHIKQLLLQHRLTSERTHLSSRSQLCLYCDIQVNGWIQHEALWL